MYIPEIENNAVESFKTGFSDMFHDCLIDVNAKIERQPVCISIGEGYYGQTSFPIPFGSYGDYSCIVGSSKSKKTFLKSALIAGYIGGQSDMYFPDVKGHDVEGKYIIDIDTEQSDYHSHRVFKRVIEMVGGNYELYKPFSLRRYSPDERMQFVEWLLNESELKGKIGLVSIDGYADLINDFNSLEQSQELSSKLLKWTAEHKCHITGVLHKNFGSDKPVGHIGSTILKKAETVLFVENQELFTAVSCRYSRNVPIENFSFTINDKWLPTTL